MSDTPRTDAVVSGLQAMEMRRAGEGDLAAAVVQAQATLVQLARQLEREMAQAKLPVIGECEECGQKIVTPLRRL